MNREITKSQKLIEKRKEYLIEEFKKLRIFELEE